MLEASVCTNAILHKPVIVLDVGEGGEVYTPIVMPRALVWLHYQRMAALSEDASIGLK